jgi:hypothetical protein
LSDLDPQQVTNRVTGHFQSCFPVIRSVTRPVFESKNPTNDSPKTKVDGIIKQKNVNQGKSGNLCYSWESHGECKRGSSCPFSHPDAYKGTKKEPGVGGSQPGKTTGPAETTPTVPIMLRCCRSSSDLDL